MQRSPSKRTEAPKVPRSRAPRLLSGALIAGLILAVSPIVASPAFAAAAITGSVDRINSYRGASATYTLTVTNSSTASESLGSVAVGRPSTSFTVTACPQAPAGWTAAVSQGTYCIYNSAAGTGDNLAAGQSQTFKVTASVVTGTATVTGATWDVWADGTDTIVSGDGYVTGTAASFGALNANIYAIEVTDVVVATASSALGAACPAANKKAPAGSTRVLTVCGRNSSGSAFSVRSQDSSLGGTFLSNDGNLAAGNIPSGSGNVVLANWTGATVTSTVGSGRTISPTIANRGVGAPTVTLTGYTTDTTAPAAPGTPDLVSASDSGSSATDNVTNDTTPTFTGVAEANSTVEILVAGVVKGSATANGAGAYTATGTAAQALADGNHSVTVRATDASGNVGAASSALSVTIDTSNPAGPTIGTRPGSTGTDTTPTWGFSGEAGGTYVCKLTYPNSVQVTDNNCVSSKTFNVAGEGDGIYTFRVSQIDAAGNTSPDTIDTYTLDRGLPAAPSITSRPANVTTDASPSWSFTGEAGAVFRCVLVKPDLSEVTFNSCTSPRTFDLTSASDGTYTFKVLQVDEANNESPYATDSFLLDRAVPGTPSIDAAPAARSNDETPSWTFSGENGATFQCVLVKPGNVQVTDSPCDSPMSYSVAGTQDGAYTFKVRQLDGAENASPYATSTFTLDRVAPAEPQITARPANFDDDDTPVWSFTGEASARFECVLVHPDATEVTDTNCTSSKAFNVAGEDDGTYTFKIRQIDVAGNEGAYETDDYTLDRLAPVAPSLNTRPNDIVSNPSVQWTFTGEDNAVFTCVLVRPDATEVTDTSCGSPKAYDLSTGTDGVYTFKLLQTDRAGHPSSFVTDSFTLDRQPPGPPTITAQPASISNDDTPEWDFSGENNTTFECVLVKPSGVNVTTQNCDGPKGYNVAADNDGTFTFKVRQFDAVGNGSPFTTHTYTLDRQGPSAPQITSRPRTYDDNPAPTWAFTGEQGATFQCVLVRPDTTQINVSPCASPKVFDLTAESDGTYLFKVRQVDAAGNPGVYETDDYTFDRSPPRPILTGGGPAGTFTNDPTHAWTFTGVPTATFECRLIRPNLADIVVTNCTSPVEFDLTTELDGDYTVTVRQFLDDNGSVPAEDSFRLDRVAAAPTVGVQPGPRSNDDSPEWTFTGEAGATFECVLTDPSGAETTEPGCTSTESYSLAAGIDGTYSLKVRQTDLAGNTSTWASKTYVLDRQAPLAPVVTSRPKARTNDLTPVFGFTGEEGAIFNCKLTKPGGIVQTNLNCSSPKAYVLDKVQGRYTFTVTQVDQAGNESVAVSRAFRLDLTPPTILNLRVGPKRFYPARGSVVTVKFGRSEASKAIVTIMKGRKILKVYTTKPVKANVFIRWKALLKGDPIGPGKYTVKVKLTDKVGNSSSAKKTFTATR